MCSTLTFERGDFGGKNLGITQHLILIRVVVVKTLSKIFKNVLALRPTISFLKMLCCRIEGALTACLASSLALHRNNHTVSNTQIRRNVIKKPSRWAANSLAFYKHYPRSWTWDERQITQASYGNETFWRSTVMLVCVLLNYATAEEISKVKSRSSVSRISSNL